MSLVDKFFEAVFPASPEELRLRSIERSISDAVSRLNDLESRSAEVHIRLLDGERRLHAVENRLREITRGAPYR